jgi:hypothetical protein
VKEVREYGQWLGVAIAFDLCVVINSQRGLNGGQRKKKRGKENREYSKARRYSLTLFNFVEVTYMKLNWWH